MKSYYHCQLRPPEGCWTLDKEYRQPTRKSCFSNHANDQQGSAWATPPSRDALGRYGPEGPSGLSWAWAWANQRRKAAMHRGKMPRRCFPDVARGPISPREYCVTVGKRAWDFRFTPTPTPTPTKLTDCGLSVYSPLDVTNARRYHHRVIRDFRCQETQLIWQGRQSRKLPPDIQDVARRKLRMLNNAQDIQDLRVPPNNRLEALKGDRKRQHSIRINQKWRLCFVWRAGDAHDVEIVDYHGG